MEPPLHEAYNNGESSGGWMLFNPVTFLFQFLASYGWYLLGSAVAIFYTMRTYIGPRIADWLDAQEEAAYHKNPDIALPGMEGYQIARERQQYLLQVASDRALEAQKEREEQKRLETLERLQKYGNGGQRLGEKDERDYLPLSAGASTSSYRPPKKSKCGGGGCGR